MKPQTSPATESYPAWFPLLKKPYDQLFGGRSAWDLRTPDGRPLHIERGGPGLGNAVFRVRLNGDIFGCKLFIADERQRVCREWVALNAFAAAGLTVAPTPVAYAPGGPLPQPAIVYRWIEGEPPGNGPLPDDDLIQLVTGLHQVHRTPPLPGTTPLPAWLHPANYQAYLDEISASMALVQDWAASSAARAVGLPAWVADLPALTPLLIEAVRQAAAVVKDAGSTGAFPTPVLVHADGNLDSILRDTAGNLVFMNWESSGWGDPAYDLAKLRWHPRALHTPAAQWDAALATYQPLPTDTTFSERIAVYDRLAPVWWIGRSAMHLLEGAGQLNRGPRLGAIPARMYRAVRAQLNTYLAALGLIEPPEGEAREKEA